MMYFYICDTHVTTTQIERQNMASTPEGSHLRLQPLLPEISTVSEPAFWGAGVLTQLKDPGGVGQDALGASMSLCVSCRYDVDSKSPDLSKHVSSPRDCPEMLKVS